MTMYKFCPLCGLELVGNYEKGKFYPKCPTGHFTYYPSLTVGTAAILHHEGKILLEQRAVNTGYGLWALPGGMVEPGEEVDECLIREVLEETGLTVEIVRLFKVTGGKRVSIVFYEAKWMDGELSKSDESLELGWFTIEEIPFEQFAFQKQKEVLKEWIDAECT